MSHQNSFTEWIYQTRKLSKMVDYTAIDLIDLIVQVVVFVDKKNLEKHRDFFKRYCTEYNKPNPIGLAGRLDRRQPKEQRALVRFIEGGIALIHAQEKQMDIQWFEIVDFMYERPELVNPSIVNDEYLVKQIDRVCANDKKNNPLRNGITVRFGKEWKDAKGHWNPERRRRF